MSVNGALLELIGDMQGLLDLDEFRAELLHAVRRAVPAEWVSLNDLGSDPDTYVVIADPSPPPDSVEVFARYAHQNPLVAHYAHTRNGRAMRFSDLVTREQLHELDLYQLVYKQLGVEYQLAFTLPHTKGRILGVALSRRDRDFTDAERDPARAGPPLPDPGVSQLDPVHRRAQGPRPAGTAAARAAARAALTRRQAEVLRIVSSGASERDVATSLGISVRTVQKHLERCYRTLGVDSRSRAAAIAWTTIDVQLSESANEVARRGYSPSMNPASSAASPGSSSAA
jgi:DNA-binding CsgD family transcriptional regulator